MSLINGIDLPQASVRTPGGLGSSTPALAWPEDLPAVVEFLSAAYHAKPEAPFLAPDLLRWKYFEPRPDWDGPRSYVLRKGSEIGAHGCVAPSLFRTGSRELRGIRVIDWAGSRRFPGAGILMMQKLNEWSDILMAVGGSQDTLRVLPKIGFEHHGDLAAYARVVRPWGRFRTDPFPRGWKAPLRLARELLWAASAGSVPAAGGWLIRPVERFDASAKPALEYIPPGTAQPARSPELLNYMLACPGAAMRGFLILENATVRGYCLLSRLGGQARIAELRLSSSDETEWRTAYALATKAAAADPLACEILTTTAIPMAARALEANGYRLRYGIPILLRDPRGRLKGMPPLNINMLEGDEAYVFDATNPFSG